MYYFLHGADTKKSVDKARSMVDAIISKKPNASVFKLDEFNWNPALFQELMGGQALFESKYVVLLSRLFDNVEAKETLLDFTKELRDSDNIFIWVENNVDSKSLKNIKEHAEKVQSFELKDVVKKVDFNIFGLADAFANRDKKKLWMLYHEALEYQAVEEIHGTLFWQLKNMLIATKTTAPKSGLKPFVYNKAKMGATKYKQQELDTMARKMISISHDARRGLHDFEIAMERFVLEV